MVKTGVDSKHTGHDFPFATPRPSPFAPLPSAYFHSLACFVPLPMTKRSILKNRFISTISIDKWGFNSWPRCVTFCDATGPLFPHFSLYKSTFSIYYFLEKCSETLSKLFGILWEHFHPLSLFIESVVISVFSEWFIQSTIVMTITLCNL